MKHKHPIQISGAAVVVAITFLLSLGAARADTVKTKDGKTLEGVITFEADDMLKIRVQKSASISETVTVLKSNVLEVMKSAPDDVDFAKMKGYLPTPSLMTTSQYRTMIEKGPQAFLNSYLDSKHRPDVEKLKKELEDEMGKVNLGFIKIEGEWISPKAQRDFRELIDARILNLAIRQKAQGGDFIGSLRGFETMEETYFGTPSYIESVKTMLQLLPSVGQRLQQMVANVEFLNKQFEENLAKMPEEKRGPVMAARKQEEDQQKRGFEADKASGIKWYQVNTRDKADLTAYIQMVAAEIDSLKNLDLIALEEQAKQLVKVDELIAEDKIKDAKELLKETTGMSSGRGKSSSSRGSSSPYGGMSRGGSSSRGSRSSKTKAKSSYIIVLQDKIGKKEEAIAAKITQEKNTAEGEEARKAILQGRNVVDAAPVLGAETVEGQGGGSNNAGTNALTGLIDSTEVPEKKDPAANSKSKPTKTKKPASKKPKDDDDDEDEVRKPVSSGGFKWTFQKIIIGVALLMALTVGLMKMLGIGGAKAE